jgi:y4mF family transcriptional regulator
MSTNEDINMKHAIQSTEELGLVIRAVRKSTQVRQDDLAAMVGVSRQFTVDVEKGKPTVQLARVLRLLKELGIELSVDIPSAASQELERLARRSSESSRLIATNGPPAIRPAGTEAAHEEAEKGVDK